MKKPPRRPGIPRLTRPEASSPLARPTPRTGRPGAGLHDIAPHQIIKISGADAIAIGRHVNRNDPSRVGPGQ